MMIGTAMAPPRSTDSLPVLLSPALASLFDALQPRRRILKFAIHFAVSFAVTSDLDASVPILVRDFGCRPSGAKGRSFYAANDDADRAAHRTDGCAPYRACSHPLASDS
jgi:hypothetical protein